MGTCTCKRIDLIILLLAVFHSALVWSEEPELKIYPELPTVTAPSLVSYVLTCKGMADEEDAFTDMTWRDPNDNVIEEERSTQGGGVRKIGKNTLRLTFFAPEVGKSGKYSCSALYMDTEIRKASIIVNFYDDIKFEECSEQQSLILGMEGEIRCTAVGNPSPEITWSKDGQPVTSDSSRYMISSDKLSVSEVVEDDQGTYTIEAYVLTTGRNEYRNIKVTVQIPPKIKDLPEMRVIENERYEIQCIATGFPKPKFTWLDPNLNDLSQVPGFSVNPDDGTLIIEEVKRDYSGEYRCKAENEAGADEKTMALKVTVKPKIISFHNITQEEGNKVELICSADGDPAPKVAIRKDKGQYFEENENEDPRINVVHSVESGITSLTLAIMPVKRADDGLYFCSAENDGARVERAGHIEVHFPPNMDATPYKEVKTWPANPANMTCIAEANPNATITWKFQNEIITPEDERYVIYGTTSISNLLVKLADTSNRNSVYGTYTCMARNPLGEQSVDIRLEEAMAPGQLSQVLFDHATPTTISFGFLGPSSDGGMPVMSFVAKYKMEEAPESEEQAIEWPKGSPYIISKLKPRMHYKFKLAAKNAVGIGDWKEEKYVMPEETFPSLPSFITVMETVSDYSDRFEIKWNIPDDNGKPIKYFDIRYFKVERDADDWRELPEKAYTIRVDNSYATSYELTNLDANTFYKVELRAYNEIGYSGPGVVVFRTRSGEISDEQTSMIENGVIPLAGIIAIAVVAVLIILIVMDVTCYLRYHCGLLYVMRYQTCGRSPSSEKVKDIAVEDGPECKRRVEFTNCEDKINCDFPYEDSPMLSFSGGRDTRPADLIIDQNYKNRSPKGSKSSLGKSSPV